MKIHPYLNCGDKAEAAMRFYAQVLGGKLTEIHRFGSMPKQDGFALTPEQEALVLHVGLELPDGQMIMASDMIEGMVPVTMPIADQFRGDYFGSLTDRFGINWMVNYSDPAHRQQ